MCLSIPAQLISIQNHSQVNDPVSSAPLELLRSGKVNLGGILKEVSLAYVPEAKVGDYVLVHVGFAISIINEKEAQFVTDFLKNQSQNERNDTQGFDLSQVSDSDIKNDIRE